MNTGDLEKIKRALAKTGHIFEHQIGALFESKGWMIIPNKFYLDRDDNKGREIDLVAYKISELRDKTAYITVVVIEAKQSNKNKWIFFTKGGYSGDINMHTAPLFFHNEIDEVGRYLDQNALLDGMADREQLDLFNSSRKAYTFAEITDDRKGQSGSFFRAIATNAIYNAIFGVIKAQMSELEFYRNRRIAKNEQRFYMVFPLVVFNGDMLEAQIAPDGEIDLTETREIQYVNRYRSLAYDNFHSVNIIQRDILPRYIDLFSDIHQGLGSHAGTMIDRFYDNLDLTSFELLWERIISRLHDEEEQFSPFNPGNLIPHHFNAQKGILEIYVDDVTLYKTLTTRPIFDFTEAMGRILTKICSRPVRPQVKNHSKILNP